MSPRQSAKTKERTISESLQEYGRGVAGGPMFSLPLLYTREVWWAGFIAHPYRLIAYVLATFVLLLGYNRYSGLRRDSSMKEVAIDSVEEMGIGLLLGALLLFLLGRITYGMSAIEIAGMIVVEAMTVAIGVSIGTAQLGAGGKEDEGLEGTSDKNEIHFGGASDFVRADHPTVILLGTVVTYAIALSCSALILWFFGSFEGVTLFTALAQTVVLGVAATLGASAGRLLLQ